MSALDKLTIGAGASLLALTGFGYQQGIVNLGELIAAGVFVIINLFLIIGKP